MNSNYHLLKRLFLNFIKKSLMLFLLFFLCNTTGYSQSKKEWLDYADAAFKIGDYHSAANFYMNIVKPPKGTAAINIQRPYQTHTYTPPKKKNKYSAGTDMGKIEDEISSNNIMNQYVIHQIAECYRLSREYLKAEEWFKKSVDVKSEKYPLEHFWYADALMKNEKYKEAKEEFEMIMGLAERKDSIIFKQSKLKIAGCYLALDTKKTHKDVSVESMDSIFNRGTANFAANYYGDPNTLQFSTARDGNTINLDPEQPKMEARFICDIYSIKKTDGKWGNLEKIPEPINSAEHEAAGFLTIDRSSFYFTRWSTTNKNECNIYRSRFLNNKWLAAEKLNDLINLEGYKTIHPALSINGDVLYFSSNRPGGYGKMDIWYINLDENGQPKGEAKNMGPMINTSQDEVTPFIHYYTSTLYYSSEGLAGYGGLDVYKSTYNKDDGVWSVPANLGRPINSSKDDAHFVLERGQQNGFISSDRKYCENCEGGSCMKIYQVTKELNVFEITGTVYNAETDEVIPSALITFKDIRGDNEPFYLTTDEEGKYYKELTEGMELFIKAQKNKFFSDATNISTVGLTESELFIKDFFLSPIPEGEIVIPGIEYDYDKATLRPDSKKILDQLADFFTLNNDISVEIRSHTDDRGGDDYNLKLSQERAKSVVDYLIGKGISKDRLVAKGLGETELLIKKATTEEEHQKNRRTAFRPLKEGMIMDAWKGKVPKK